MGNDLTGKVVFLTGGQRGIGLCIKNTFEKMGARVISPSIEELNLLSRESTKHYVDCFNDKVDIYIHCAGINNVARIEDINIDDVTDTFEINYFCNILLLKKMIPEMKKKNDGKIVFISSLYALVSKEGRISYSSSKNALTGLCKTLALELGPHNIMVNCLAPGYVMTEMTKKNLSKDEIEKIEKMIPTGRFQQEQEIADAVVFLASDSNKSITGQVLAVDGGFLCR